MESSSSSYEHCEQQAQTTSSNSAMSKDISKWTVGELRSFLKGRGVPASGYVKSQLLDMVRRAQQSPQILEEIQENDNEEISKKRRTIEICGKYEVFPHPATLTDWKKELDCIPHITKAHCYTYLLLKQNWPSGKIQEIEKGRGYLLYTASHIRNIMVKNMLHNTIFIRATCIRQTKQKENPYTVWLLAASNGDVYTGGCQCIGDDGGCKHVVALLFAVAEYTEKKGQQSCTDVASTWDKPHSLGKSNCRLDSIDCRSDGTTPQAVKPYPCNFNPILEVNTGYTSSDMDADMLDVALSNDNAVMLGVLQGYTPPSPPPSIPDLVTIYKNRACDVSFVDFLKNEISENIRIKIFKTTKKQHKSQTWKRQRIGALTASTLHKAARYKGNENDNYIVKMIMGESTFAGNNDTKYGIKHEPVARKLYEESLKKNHKGAKVVNSGLMIWEDNPLVRASPDGIVSCKCCGKGLVEIKCPSKHRFLSGEEIARDGTYYLELRNGVPKLKTSSPWYTQIQIQLAVSQFSWCDFVLFTKSTPHITSERIYFVEETCVREVESAMSFHEKFVMPRLLDK